jgi:hypothetical protein
VVRVREWTGLIGFDGVGTGRRAVRALGVLAILGLSLALAPMASASGFSLTWTGGSAGRTESAAHWSTGANWVGSTAPTTSQAFETLTFPHLSNSECTSEPPTDTCYLTLNDVSGLSAESIQLDDADDYLLAGEPITLGSGGLTATPGASQEAGTFIETPLDLSATQTWHIASGGRELGENGVLLAGGLTGSGSALTVELSSGPLFFLAENDTEVGPVALDGANTNKVAANGIVSFLGAKLNSSNGEPVSLSHVFFAGSGEVGQLSTSEADLDIGSPAKGIEVTSAKLDSASYLEFNVVGDGMTAQTDYSQLLSHGPVELSGAKIEVVVRPPKEGKPCPTLLPGQKYTFVSTTNTLSGSFSDALENEPEIPIRFATACDQISQKMRIKYHETGDTQTVTGTVEEAAATKKQEEEAAAKKKREEEEAANTKKHEEEAANKKSLEEGATREANEAPRIGAEEEAKKREEEERPAKEAAAAAAKEREIREAGERAGREAAAKEEAAAKKKLEEKAKASTKPLTSAQLLAKALKSCKKKPKKQRAQCEATAKKRYGPKKKVKKK